MPRAQLGRDRTRRLATRKTGNVDEDEIPEVYRELIAEADARDAENSQPERFVKRRRVGERGPSRKETVSNVEAPDASESNPTIDLTHERTVYDLEGEDDSDEESDMEWEEVIIHQPQTLIQDKATEGGDESSLNIILEGPTDQRRTIVRRRKPVSGVEKKLRLDIHKTHVLCLLQHVYMRNLWCNDDELQKFLKQMLTKQHRALLNPRQSMHQFTQSTTFIDGLKQVSETFARRFRVTAPGLRKPFWVENEKEGTNRAASIVRDGEIISNKEDFCAQAKTLQGSRDFGAQLFCALLRSVAVEARLVCSLQVLPFSGVAKGVSPEKPKRDYIVISSDDNASSSDDKAIGYSHQSPAKGRRLAQPSFKTAVKSSSSPYLDRPRTFPSSPHPIFWIEAFNEAVQKWIPVDPLVTKSVAKPTKFEPPASDRYNSMSYVVAFEEDASARDVTKRYAKAYNAKLRKTRVESTKDGERWWIDVMNHFEKPFREDRDQLEISEFTAKSAAEPMPRNIQDFKDHPIYVLERHLRRNEVLHPKRVIGQVEVKKGSLEPVYRRADVHVVRSADSWYRLGRDIKLGEQPLKRAAALNRTNDAQNQLEGLAGPETPLYAIYQTELYKPPPVVNGKVPKNVYGNLDIYVPSMIPLGGFHLRHKEASRAARILGIDYADAVTGFEFRGRHGTAVINGIVTALEYRQALEEVIIGLEDERMQEELDQRTKEALGLWKHFLLKLRIAEKVNSYAFEGEDSRESDNEHPHNDAASNESDFAEGGGFLPESDENDVELSTRDSHKKEGFDAIEGGGFVADADALDEEETLPVFQPTQKQDISEHVASFAPNKPPTRKSRKSIPHYKLIVISKAAKTEKNKESENLVQTKHTSGIHHNASMSEDVSHPAGSSIAEPIQVDTSNGSTPASTSVVMTSTDPVEITSQKPSVNLQQSDSDSDIDKVSLLSHDPEDDDAEPDWLMSD